MKKNLGGKEEKSRRKILPQKVRNKMGYMKDGGVVRGKARKGCRK